MNTNHASPHIAIAILNWNGRDWLERFLPSVLATTYGRHSVHVIDNGSTDDTVSWLTATYPSINLLALPSNGGYAGGYNDGLAQIEADVYCLLNSDVEVQPDWLQAIAAAFASKPAMAACQPKVLSHSQPTHFEYAGACGGFMDGFGYPFCRGRVLDTLEADNGQYDEPMEVFWATGACLFVRADAWRQAKGLDAAFFAHMEEIDLCWRLKNLAHQVWAIPQSVVYHVGGGTLTYGSTRKTFLNFRNSLLCLARNDGSSMLWAKFVVRAFLDVAAAGMFITKGEGKHAGVIWKAWSEAWKLLPAYLKQRPRRKLKLVGQLHSILVVDYFLMGRKTWDKLQKRIERRGIPD